MKEKLLIIISFTIFIFGCEVPKRNMFEFENKQQSDFDSFLKNKNDQRFSYSNKIQKKEFFNEFGKELSTYMDSVKLFINWKANIQDIKTREWNEFTEISFKLNYEPEEHREISFYCSYLVKTDSLTNDYLYNKVKNISDYSTVYFDGFIRRDKNNNIVYESVSEDLKISYPNYKMNILSISSIKKSDTLSLGLRNAINNDFKVFDLLKQKLNKSISEREWKRQLYMLSFNKIESELTSDEKQYSLRLKQYLIDDLVI